GALGDRKFFLGTDSAPHEVGRKLHEGCAGIFDPYSVEVLTTILSRYGGLDSLEDFAVRRGAAFYGLPVSDETIDIVPQTWTVPRRVVGLVPLLEGETLDWQIAGMDYPT